MDSQKPRSLGKIKSSLLSRGLSIAKMTLNTGTQLAGHGLSTLLSTDSEKDEKWKLFLKSQAKHLSHELGELKGSLMKAGQMLSMYGEHFLPPEANDLLKTLQSQSPALEWKAMDAIIQKRMTPEQLSQIEINPVSIGSASLGQVHKAQIKATKEWIALKVQYPGVDQAIDSDLRALKSFLSMMKLLPKNLPLEDLFAEVRQMLVQEINYENEIHETELYRARLEGERGYIVPRIYREFCSDKVIASSFEQGLSADDPMIRALSQERRNHLALLFLDLYFRELFQWGIVQTDPHLGNYKIRLSASPAQQPDQLVLFDFGAVRNYPSSFLGPYTGMIRAALQRDLTGVEMAARQLQFLTEDDSPELKKSFVDFCITTVEPFMGGVYDYASSDLPARLTKKAFEMVQQFKIRTPPQEVIFLDRKTGGVFIWMKVLGAKVDGRDLFLEYLKNSVHQ